MVDFWEMFKVLIKEHHKENRDTSKYLTLDINPVINI